MGVRALRRFLHPGHKAGAMTCTCMHAAPLLAKQQQSLVAVCCGFPFVFPFCPPARPAQPLLLFIRPLRILQALAYGRSVLGTSVRIKQLGELAGAASWPLSSHPCLLSYLPFIPATAGHLLVEGRPPNTARLCQDTSPDTSARRTRAVNKLILDATSSTTTNTTTTLLRDRSPTTPAASPPRVLG